MRNFLFLFSLSASFSLIAVGIYKYKKEKFTDSKIFIISGLVCLLSDIAQAYS